jgi:hypothetical protein
MSGGQSHMDTWDVKEGVETAGPTKPIKTSADGVRISEYLPNTAKHMHHGTILNSLSSTQGAHEQGNYMMHTSYELRGTIRHPAMGAWLNVFQAVAIAPSRISSSSAMIAAIQVPASSPPLRHLFSSPIPKTASRTSRTASQRSCRPA